MTIAGVAVLTAVVWTAGLPLAQGPGFRSGTDAVRVDVSVTRGGVPVHGLTLEDFELRDSQVPQRLDDVSVDTVPLNLLLVLDVSGSIQGEQLAALKRAAHTVTNQLRPADHLALLTFSAVVRRDLDWSSDRVAVDAAVDRLSGSRRTSLYAAVSIATSMRASSPPGRMHVLLVTDGFDTSSWISPSVVIDQVRRSDLVIHVVRLSAPSRFVSPTDIVAAHDRRTLFLARPELAPAELLPLLAEDTGGELIDAGSDERLEAICARLVESFRSRYVLAYSPSGVPAHGWHPITVSVKNHRANVVARRGYDR